MSHELLGAAFGGQRLNAGRAAALIAQATGLLARAAALAR
jgi:hypothetical protein